MSTHLNFVATSVTYAIDIEMGKFVELLNIERTADYPLCDLLKRIPGVSEIDYDGHFGNYIYLTIETDYDSPLTKEQITNVINEYLIKIPDTVNTNA